MSDKNKTILFAVSVFLFAYVVRIVAGLTVFTEIVHLDPIFTKDPVWNLAGQYVPCSGSSINAGKDLTEGQPVYTYFLGVLRCLSNDNGFIILLGNTILGSITCSLVFFLILILTNSTKLSLFGALILGLFPNQIRLDLLLFDQSMFAALYTGSAVLLVKYLIDRKLSLLALSALFLSISYLTRATIQLFIIAVMLIIIASEKKLLHAVLFLIIFLLPPSLLSLRNYIKFNNISNSDSDKWYLIYLGNNEYTDKFYPEYSVTILQDYAIYRYNAYLDSNPVLRDKVSTNPYESDNIYKSMLKEYVSENKLLSIWRYIKKSLHFFSPIPIPYKGHIGVKMVGNEWVAIESSSHVSKYKRTIYFLTFGPLLILSIIGSLKLIKSNPILASTLIAAIVTQAMITSLIGASTRYTAMIVPIMVVLAVCSFRKYDYKSS